MVSSLSTSLNLVTDSNFTSPEPVSILPTGCDITHYAQELPCTLLPIISSMKSPSFLCHPTFPLCFLLPGPRTTYTPPSHHFPSASSCCTINAPFDTAHNLTIILSSGDAGAMQPANVSQRASVPSPSCLTRLES